MFKVQGFLVHETRPVLSFGVFCLTKKDDRTLLLRIGAWTTSCLGLSNDRNDITVLGPSTLSCRKKTSDINI
ncbi:hypothetical protein Hanom_Chr04g00366121 [Helianthus anomalus]